MTKQTRLYNQIGGGAFGFARGLILIGLGYLGYSYYLDEARQPDSVKNAVTRPIAAGLAGWFEGFAPASTELENVGAEPAQTTGDAAQNGYDRADRTSLDEIVTTVTTNGEDPQAPAAEEDIADLLTGDNQ